MVTNPRGRIRTKPDPIALATKGLQTSEQLQAIVPLGDSDIMSIIQTDFGYCAVHRQVTETLDSVHGTPTAVTYSDATITLVASHLSTEEIARDDSGLLKQGDKMGCVDTTVDVLEGDIILEKDPNGVAHTNTTASSTQVIIAADVRHTFAVNDWLTTSANDNTSIYKVTGVAWSSPNTTLTVALDASLGANAYVYKVAMFKVVGAQTWPNEVDALYKAVHMRPMGL